MYRFFKTQYASLSNVYFSSKRSSVERLQLCSFCKVHHLKTSIGTWFIKKHCYGTVINGTEVYYAIKKKARIKRKYAELLEVTDQATSNKKAAVKKLNASHLSLLMNLPDVTLDKLHKINGSNPHEKRNKKSIKTTNTRGITNDASNIEEHINVAVDSAVLNNFGEHADETSFNHEDLRESSAHIPLDESLSITSLLEDENVEKIQDETISKHVTKKDEIKKNKLLKSIKCKREKNQSETIKQKKQGNTQRVFSEHTTNMMLAQMDAYLACKMYNRAEKLLKFVTKHVHATPSTVYADVCNMLLEAYCLNKDVKKVLELYNLMIQGSAMNSQTYAIVFEFIGEMKNKIRQQDLFEKIESDMVNNGISFHDIFNKTKFKLNQSENVLRTIKLFRPEYQPEYVIPQLSYECNLLNNLSKINSRKSPVESVMTPEELNNCLKKQIDQEKQCSVYVDSIEKFDAANNNTILSSKKRIAALESSWEEVILKAFKKNIMYLEQKECSFRPPTLNLYPFLKILPPEEYVQAVIQEVRNLIRGSAFFTPPLTTLYGNLGFLLYRKYEMQTKQNNGVLNKTVDIYTKYFNWYAHTDTFDDQSITNSRTAWQRLAHKYQHYGASLDTECVQWPYFVCVNVGKFLYNIIINEIKINIDNQATDSLKYSVQTRETPAFYTLFRSKGKMMVEQIKPHPILSKLYKDAQSTLLTFDATFIPSLCPPRPWVSINTGGYTISKVEFVRAPYCAKTKQLQILESVPPSKIYPALDNLNQLGSVPWKVNTSVLDILIKVFQDGGSVKLNVPQPPSILTEDLQLIKNKNIFSKERVGLKQKMNEMYGLWCDCLYKLSLANHYRNHIFWLPHNLDFRGRVYPIPPHLTHLGSDLARSILIFAQGKPLGPQGLDWLKIHTINLTGLKKRESMNKRLIFANEIIDKIVDSAENPLTGEMWWAESDEPWQTLASCMEVTKALKSPNPEKYLSSFPVHQDGSCNGLQHYAALGRDQIGAESVNLQPADTPQDVYSVVAGMIETVREKDAARGLRVAQDLEGHIKRKVIKQTVMTTVYGVTKYGAKLQIMKQLKDLDGFPIDRVWEASNYLTCKTFDSLQTMFTSARTIQDWFSNCAYLISSIFGERVEWVTPLGFLVVQPYVRVHKHTINEEHFAEEVDSLKQRNAFPPNFIHSLDSSHMMLTSLFCEQAGITFMSVHDCFWTHPCTIDIMNKICREQFVALHSEPILENLSMHLHKKYLTKGNPLVESFSDIEKENASSHFSNIPIKGSFNLKNILKSTYFFS